MVAAFSPDGFASYDFWKSGLLVDLCNQESDELEAAYEAEAEAEADFLSLAATAPFDVESSNVAEADPFMEEGIWQDLTGFLPRPVEVPAPRPSTAWSLATHATYDERGMLLDTGW